MKAKKTSIFLPLTKVNVEERLVYGTAAVEQLDKAGEIFDYESSKPLFQKWSQDISKISLPLVQAFGECAQSYGNVREMHEKMAAGKLAEPLTFNDVNKTIQVCAKIVDDQAWEKVKNGVYTGFSIGGTYEKTWADPSIQFKKKAATRYAAAPSEISVVDNPCMPDATFSMVKADGTLELHKFATVELGEEDIPRALYKVCEGLAATSGGAPSEHERALRVMKRAQELKVDASGFAKAYMQEYGGQVGAQALKALQKRVPGGDVKKSLWDVSDIASTLMNLNYCRMCLESEAEYENDGSLIPARLKEIIETLAQILVDLAAEESAELTGGAKNAAKTIGKEINQLKKFFEDNQATIEKLAASGDAEVSKMATHLKEIGKHVDGIRKAHDAMGDHLNELDPKDGGGDGAAEPDDKSEKAANAALRKSVEALQKSQEESNKQITHLAEAMTTYLKNTPAPSRVAVNGNGVTKAADSAAAGSDPNPKIDPKDPDAALKVMKMIHAGGANAAVLAK